MNYTKNQNTSLSKLRESFIICETPLSVLAKEYGYLAAEELSELDNIYFDSIIYLGGEPASIDDVFMSNDGIVLFVKTNDGTEAGVRIENLEFY